MVNKRGWLRIVEAVVSILIVFGAVLTVATTHRATSTTDYCSTLAPLLEEIAKNTTLREDILVHNNTASTEQFLAKRVRNPALAYEVRICEPDGTICPHSQSGYENVDICAEERIIAATPQGFNPKKLKIFLFKA